MIDKYNEYPCTFILKLFCNGVHIETLLTKDLKIEKLNQYRWQWNELYDKA